MSNVFLEVIVTMLIKTPYKCIIAWYECVHSSIQMKVKTGALIKKKIRKAISFIYYRFCQFIGKLCGKQMPAEKRWLCGSCAPQRLEAQTLRDVYRSLKSEIRLSMRDIACFTVFFVPNSLEQILSFCASGQSTELVQKLLLFANYYGSICHLWLLRQIISLENESCFR